MSKLLARAAAVAGGDVSQETGAGNVSYYWQDESKIIDNPFQYRMVYDPEKLLSLAENIALLKNDLPTLGLEQLPYARLVRLVDGDYMPIPREEMATPERIAFWMGQPGVLAELMFAHRRRRAWTVIRYGVEEGCKRLADFPTEALEVAKQAVTNKSSPDQLKRNVTHRLETIEEKRKVRAMTASAREACKGWCLPGQTTPVGEEVRVNVDVQMWQAQTFNETSSTELGLLQSGMCGKHCECFCLIRKRHVEKGDVQPDPTNAPEIVAACTSPQRRNSQERKWQKQHAPTAQMTDYERKKIESERQRRQVRDEKEQAGKQLIDQTLASLNLRTMWNSVEFWKEIAKRNMPEQFYKRLEKAKSINEVTELYCRWWLDGGTNRRWTHDTGDTTYDMSELQKSLRQLRTAAGVSVETGET